MNEKEIEKIANQERKIVLAKWFIGASFFPLIIAAFWIYIKAITEPVVNPLLDIEHDQMVATKIIFTFSLLAALLIIGYFCNWELSKKLDRLWEQKKTLF